MTFFDNFQDKIKALENELKGVNEGVACTGLITIGAIAAPIVTWLVLYFLNPYFVRGQYKKKRDNSKVLMWTVFITIIIWVIMYFYAQSNLESLGGVCMFPKL